MKRYCFKVTLIIAAPVLSQAAGGRAFGVDAASRKDNRDNKPKPLLPGSLVRGNLREAWENLAGYSNHPHTPSEDDIRCLLGPAYGKNTKANDEPERGRLGFSEHWVARCDPQHGHRHRIAIDQKTGSVEHGALQVIEDNYAVGEEIDFFGTIEGDFEDQEAQRIQGWITKGLEFIPAMGAFKGVGFGRLKRVAVTTKEITVDVAGTTLSGDRFGITLTLDRPFCFARPHTGSSGNNRFESEDFIPGGAIKGTLARRLGLPNSKASPSTLQPAYPYLVKHFDDVRITHAFPSLADNPRRPVSLPYSLIADKDGNILDVARKSKPGLVRGQAPAFQLDWKSNHWKRASDLCGVPELTRRLSVHNAIDRTSGRTLENALFAIESVAPERFVWLADVDLTRINDGAERAKVAEELQKLLAQDLDRLGKTEAKTLEVRIGPPHPLAVDRRDQLLVDGEAIVVLQTAARLTPDPYEIPPTNGDKQLLSVYQDAWRELSCGSLELQRFYARQMLVGGGYLWRRFRNGQPYNPELLTLPGSVFVLKATNPQKAEGHLQSWLVKGLPQLKNAPGDEDWRHTPYLAQNGYGEILVNLTLHWKEPTGGDWDDQLD